eukprot:1183554-Prorocentrum_minimum.AAC.2
MQEPQDAWTPPYIWRAKAERFSCGFLTVDIPASCCSSAENLSSSLFEVRSVQNFCHQGRHVPGGKL